MTIECKPIETETEIGIAKAFNLDKLYMAEYEGERHLGRFRRHTVAQIPELTSWNFVDGNALHPNGIPFNSLDAVWEVVELR